MTSDWFGFFFILREFVEVGTQTTQAYSLSRLIANEPLNHGVVSLLVINCWSTPLVQPQSTTTATRVSCCEPLVGICLDRVCAVDADSPVRLAL
ncbi:TPA: hypothetical protein N0F65_003190 [Lagenidium giganteum]|uniref:Secreted protein n=1 Tax=Lagenidium giganteum TaxID=4803 RepID=A0AAV2ZBP2_9STRA|nr:TPA: hypothetical protein N0F65_003190 [Lagenidium giganteum]